MEKLYRLVGAAGMCFRAFGVTIGIRVSERTTLEILRDRLPPGSRDREAGAVKTALFFLPESGAASERRSPIPYRL